MLYESAGPSDRGYIVRLVVSRLCMHGLVCFQIEVHVVLRLNSPSMLDEKRWAKPSDHACLAIVVSCLCML